MPHYHITQQERQQARESVALRNFYDYKNNVSVIPSFFSPLVNVELAEETRNSVITFLNGHGFTIIDSDNRIFGARYQHNNETHFDFIGNSIETGELVLFIFKSSMGILICTLNRGVRNDSPIMGGGVEEEDIIYFPK